jgi:GNAT superfamily N-acetyltransferase
MRITVRAAERSDVRVVRSLEERWAREGETIGFQATPCDMLERFLDGCFFVADLDGTVAGFVFGQTKRNQGSVSAVAPDSSAYFEIEDLYVAPEYRSSGAGRLLVDRAVRWAAEHGLRYLVAFSSTREVDKVLKFYRSCGFDSWAVQFFRDLGPPNGSIEQPHVHDR